MESVFTPFGKIISKQFFVSRNVLREWLRQPGIVQKMFVVDVLAGHIPGPAATAKGIRERIGIEPAAAVGHGVGHIAVDPADVGFEGQFDHAIVIFAVDGSGVTLTRETMHLLHPFDHLAEIIPLPNCEDGGDLLAGEAVFGSSFGTQNH